MRIPIEFILLVGLYISVKGEEDKYLPSDPIASEISLILKHIGNCNVIIASDSQLEHLDNSDFVPVLLYDHSMCRKNKEFCLSKQIRQRRLPHHCTRIIVAISDQVTFAEEWNSYEDDKQVKWDSYAELEDDYRYSFPSELWKAGLQFTNSYNDISYFMLSRHSEEYNYREFLISSRSSKTRSLNLFAVDVGNLIPSKYYFLCQFCDEGCMGFKEIAMTREEFLNEKLRSNFIKPFVLKSRTWQLDYKYMKLAYESLHGNEWSQFEEVVHRKSSGVSLSQLTLLKKVYILEILFERTGNYIELGGSKCRMSRIRIDHSSWNIDLSVPSNKVIWSGSSSFTFLTCHTEKGHIDFNTYITPFDVSTWIGIIVASVVTHFAFATLVWHGNIRNISQFSILQLILSWLFSFSYSPSRSISKHFWYRVISVAWFFASFVLCMFYTSFAISGVTSPLPVKSVSTFEELTSFRVCRKNTCKTYEFADFMKNKGSKDEGWTFDIYSTPIFKTNLTILSFENTHFGEEIHDFKRFYEHDKNDTEFWSSVELSDFWNSMLPLIFHETKFPNVNSKQSKDALVAILAGIEKEIVKCDRKVYVDRTQSVFEEYNYLSKHYEWLKFKVSEERELWSQNYLVFERDFDSRMSKTYNALLESGILGHMEKSYRNVLNQKRFQHTLKNKQTFPEKQQSKFQPSSMSGNIQTIFLVYLLLMAVALIVFVVEMTWIPALLTIIRWFYTMEMYINLALISFEVFVLRLRYPRNRP